MVRLFVRHDVTDFAGWKQSYDAFDDTRQQMGVRAHAAYQSADDPNNVTAWHDFETLEAARAFAGSDALRGAMETAGICSEPMIWFATQA
jgi:hypothetical protein